MKLFERATRRLRVLPAYGSLALGSMAVTAGRAWRGPLYVQVGVADPCNHRCVMCPYHPPETPVPALLPKFGGTLPGMMTRARFGALVDDFVELGVRRVDLVGRGEPMLHPTITALVRHAASAGLEVAMTTNGSKLDADSAAALADAGLTHLKVSLNAGRAHTYPTIHVTESERSFQRVLEGVRAMTSLAVRPHVTLSFTVSALNADELVDMVARAVECGADAAYFQHLVPVPERPELALDRAMLERLRDEHIPVARRAAEGSLETNLVGFGEEARARLRTPSGTHDPVPCYVGYYFSAVLGNEHVMPCCQIDAPVGSVADRSFADVWRSDAYRTFREAARKLPDRTPELDPSAECDRCYFRDHNIAVHRAMRPWEHAADSRLGLRQALRLLRLDGE